MGEPDSKEYDVSPVLLLFFITHVYIKCVLFIYFFVNVSIEKSSTIL